MTVAIAEFRFYAELNRFIARACRQRAFTRHYARDATVKHMIEALGVPHTEVEMILVNGVAADFSHRMQDGDRVSIFPHFHAWDISPLTNLHPPLAQAIRFIADAHLGRLAKSLRMLGFDVLYRNSYHDNDVVRIARDDERIVLTRDRDLLIRKDLAHGCYLYSTVCDEQVCEVLARFNLIAAVHPLSRCLACNGLLRPIDKAVADDRVPLESGRHYDRFFECESCRRVFWEGSHVARMRNRIARVLQQCGAGFEPLPAEMLPQDIR